MRCAQVITPLLYCLSLTINYQGPEHTVEVGGSNTLPSRCTLPMFHPPVGAASAPTGLGYMSNDGHCFECKNPIVIQHAFHMSVIDHLYIIDAPLITTTRSIFVVDR
jgi:hypothetical protein